MGQALVVTEPKKRRAKRSGGRTIAASGVIVWAVVTVQLFFRIPPDHVESYTSAYGAMSTAVWLAATAAFGWESVAPAVAARTDPEGATTWRDV